jgi:hypothetical protein
VDGLRLGGVRGDGKVRSEEIHERCVGWMMLRNCPRIIAQAPLLCGWSSDLDKFGAMLVIVVLQHFPSLHISKKSPYGRNLDNIYIFGRKSAFL